MSVSGAYILPRKAVAITEDNNSSKLHEYYYYYYCGNGPRVIKIKLICIRKTITLGKHHFALKCVSERHY